MAPERLLFLAFVGVLIVAAGAWESVADPPSHTQEMTIAERPNIVVVSLTTLRADHLPCYGYENTTAPNICRFAERNVRFEEAISPATWTLPGQVSIHTSLYPGTHQVRSKEDRLPDDVTTLAEALSRTGYRTGAFVGGDTESGFGHFLPRYGIDRGFDRYAVPGMSFADTVPPAIEWLSNRDGSDPFFLFISGYDIHHYGDTIPEERDRSPDFPEPNQVRSVNGSLFAGPGAGRLVQVDRSILGRIRARYDRAINFSDTMFGRLMDAIRSRHDRNETLVVVTAAHGENLGDHVLPRGRLFGHSRPYEHTIRVPLIIGSPSFSSREVGTQVSLVDLMPTFLDMASTEQPAVQGRSILPLLEGRGIPDRPAYTQGLEYVTIRSGRWKLWRPRHRMGAREVLAEESDLYDIVTDPGETDDILREHRSVAQRLAANLSRWRFQIHRHPVRLK